MFHGMAKAFDPGDPTSVTMKVTGLCAVCGRPGILHTCSICGTTVCERHIDHGSGVCVRCRSGRQELPG